MRFVVKIDKSIVKGTYLFKEEGGIFTYRIPSKATVKLLPEIKIKRMPLEEGIIAFIRIDRDKLQKSNLIKETIRVYPLFQIKKEPDYSLCLFEKLPKDNLVKRIIGIGLNEQKEVVERVFVCIIKNGEKNEQIC